MNQAITMNNSTFRPSCPSLHIRSSLSMVDRVVSVGCWSQGPMWCGFFRTPIKYGTLSHLPCNMKSIKASPKFFSCTDSLLSKLPRYKLASKNFAFSLGCWASKCHSRSFSVWTDLNPKLLLYFPFHRGVDTQFSLCNFHHYFVAILYNLPDSSCTEVWPLFFAPKMEEWVNQSAARSTPLFQHQWG